MLGEELARSLRRMGERQRTEEASENLVMTGTPNVSNPPTSAELTAAFGSLEGTAVAIHDNGVGLSFYFCIVINGQWVNFTGNKAP